MDTNEKALKLHEEAKGKLSTNLKVPLETKEDLSLAYTPGVAEPCRKIAENKSDVYKYTIKGNTVAVITDGSAVLGLGNIGPEASLPVMEGKCALFKAFADIDAFPIALDTQDPQKIIETCKLLAPVFGGINLEDISAPRCFEIEDALKSLDIPVFHDDQHGTAVVALAALINALKLTNRSPSSLKVVIAGAGAAGNAIANILNNYGVKEILTTDSKGIINKDRPDLNPYKQKLAEYNINNISGNLETALKEADVFIGVSKPNILTKESIKVMKEKPIIFALSNPIPEIMPDLAAEAGAEIIATGRSDFPNQINNVLAFPGIFKGALQVKKQISEKMKLAAAQALAQHIQPSKDALLPSALDKTVADKVAKAVIEASKE